MRGKRKDGTYGSQINVSLLVNVTSGRPICYRTYAGNVSDISTLDDMRQLWTDVGIDEKAPLVLMDRGYPNQKEIIKLNADGFKFLIGAKTSMRVVRNVIDKNNSEFYDQKTYLRNQRCYGVKSCTEIKEGKDKMSLYPYVFRSPNKEMSETDVLHDRLDAFTKAWPKNRRDNLSQADKRMLDFYMVDPIDGSLTIDEDVVSYECYGYGYFGFVGNVDISLENALVKYRQRNEVEVAFKLMFQHLMTSTRVHSTSAFDGLMMTTFVGLDILTYLRSKMDERIPNERAKNPELGSVINTLWTIQELLKDLRRIKIAYTKSGKPRLLNVVNRDRDLVAAFGFPELFASAEKVAELLTGKYLAKRLKA